MAAETQFGPTNCCKSNTDGTRKCPRYWVCHVPPGCDPSYVWLEPGVALTWAGRVNFPDPIGPVNRWRYVHVDVIPAIFRFAFMDKSITDLGGLWYGEVRAALLSGLKKDKLVDRFNPVPLDIHFAFPLVPVFGPEDPDFLPQGMTFSYFDKRSNILIDFPDCDLRMLPT